MLQVASNESGQKYTKIADCCTVIVFPPAGTEKASFFDELRVTSVVPHSASVSSAPLAKTLIMMTATCHVMTMM